MEPTQTSAVAGGKRAGAHPSRSIQQRLLVSAVIAAVLASCEGCSQPGATQPHLLKKSELTSAELKFGVTPKRDRNVEYQPGVILVDEGAEAVRSIGADGLTCAIDRHARHAEEIAVGKIAFVTGRCVGRVLAIKPEGENLSLLLGPFELTDVFRKLDVQGEEPVDLEQGIAMPAPQLPGLSFPLEVDDSGLPVSAPADRSIAEPAALFHRRRASRLQPVSLGAGGSPYAAQLPGIIPRGIDVTRQVVKPLSNSHGIGVEISGANQGVSVVAQAQIRMEKPRLEFHLGIDNGKVDASLILHNAAGLKLAIDSGASPQFARNVSWYWYAGGFSIPLGGSGLSFAVRQEFYLQTAFSARQSIFKASGDYLLNADLGLTFQGGHFTAVGPKGVTVRKSIMQNMTGVSIGPSGLVLRHRITMSLELGLGVISAGPHLALLTSLGVTKGSSIGIVECRGATLSMHIIGGVGWTIARPIVSFVNFFLHLANVRPINAHNEVNADPVRLFKTESRTNSPVCGSPTSRNRRAISLESVAWTPPAQRSAAIQYPTQE